MVEGVNQVAKDGRYKIPADLAEEVQGEYLAAFRNERGNIELKTVRVTE